MRRWIIAILAAVVGAAWNFVALALIERSVTVFPRVPDVLMDNLPRIDFGIVGEIWFFGLIALFAILHFKRQWRTTPVVLLALGLMYLIRGTFLYFFPIGAPLGSVGADARLSIWGHETHAFFPGGHIAILTIFAMFAPQQWVRKTLWAGLIVFGIGTTLAKTHYTMDSVAGILLGYAVSVWVQRRLKREHETAA